MKERRNERLDKLFWELNEARGKLLAYGLLTEEENDKVMFRLKSKAQRKGMLWVKDRT